MKVTITSCPNYYQTMCFLKSVGSSTVEQCHSFTEGEAFLYVPVTVSEVAFYLDLLATGATADLDKVFSESQIAEAITTAAAMKDVLEKRIAFAQNIIQLSKKGLAG